MRDFSRIFIVAFLLLNANSIMLAGTITGQLQLPSAGQGIRNNTVTFTLTQPAVVAGTATVVSAPWSCWTDTSGNIVGLPGDSAVAAPVLSSNLITGSFASGTYFVKYTWKNGTGESQPSAERNLVLSHSGTLILQAPASVPVAATLMQVYIGTSPNGETLQGSVTVTGGVLAGNYSQSTPLVNGTAVPSSNTSVCSIRFNDELTPSYTGYNVALFNSSGAEVQGFRQKWYLAGGISGTINLSNGTPLYAGTVVYPQAIVATPANNGQQSISGPLNLNGYGLTAGSISATSVSSTGAIAGSSVNSVVNASSYSGSDISAKVNAAEASACPNGVILVPPGNYSASTTMAAVSQCKVIMEGVRLTYTGIGTAVSIQNAQEFEIALGGSTIIGPGTGGSTIGILLGIGSGGLNTLTQSNKISGNGLLITSFNKGFALEGYASNGTYSNVIHGITARSNTIGFYLVPTGATFANANTFSDDFADTNFSDGWRLDGISGNWFYGARSENNGGWGFNLLASRLTTQNTWYSGWSESNTSGDFNAATPANVYYNQILGTTLNSSPRFGGTWDGGGTGNGNTVIPAQLTFGSYMFLPITSMAGTGNGPFAVVNQEGGTGFILAVSRTGTNAGNVYIGTPQYPVLFRGPIAQYNGVNTVAKGIPTEIAAVDLTMQNAAIGTTTLYSVPSSGAGQYRLAWNTKVTTAAGGSSTLGALTITYTDPDGVVQTITAGAQTSAGAIATTSTGNSTTTVLLGLPILINAKASTNIQYAFAYASNAANAMQYNLHIVLESL